MLLIFYQFDLYWSWVLLLNEISLFNKVNVLIIDRIDWECRFFNLLIAELHSLHLGFIDDTSL